MAVEMFKLGKKILVKPQYMDNYLKSGWSFKDELPEDDTQDLTEEELQALAGAKAMMDKKDLEDPEDPEEDLEDLEEEDLDYELEDEDFEDDEDLEDPEE